MNPEWLRFFSITTAFGGVLYLSHIFADEREDESNLSPKSMITKPYATSAPYNPLARQAVK